MTLSTFALVIAVFEFLLGVPLVLSPKKTADWVLGLTRADLLYRTVGGLFLVLCVLVLAEGMAVDAGWAGLVRLVAWIGAVKSLVICWWPERHSRWVERMLSVRVAPPIFGVAAIAAGVLLSLAGAAVRQP